MPKIPQYTRHNKYDCHGKTYDRVEDEIENWVLLHYNNRPLEIITGNSPKMQSVVKKVLKAHKISYLIPAHNLGMIIVS